MSSGTGSAEIRPSTHSVSSAGSGFSEAGSKKRRHDRSGSMSTRNAGGRPPARAGSSEHKNNGASKTTTAPPPSPAKTSGTMNASSAASPTVSRLAGLMELLRLCVVGDVDGVQLMYEQLKKDDERFDLDRLGDFTLGAAEVEGSAVMAAAAAGHVNLVHRLVEHNGVKADRANSAGITAMLLAATYGQAEVVRYLIGLPDIDIDHQDNFDQTALMLGATDGHLDVVNALLEAHCDVLNCTGDRSNNSGLNALHLAAAAADTGDSIGVMQRLIEGRADVEHQSDNGWDALYLAAECGVLPAVQMLLDQNAGVNAAMDTEEGLSPLGVAAARGHDVVLKCLLQHRALVESSESASALVRAADAGNTSIVDLLLQDRFIKIAVGHQENVEVQEAVNREERQRRIDFVDIHLENCSSLMRASRNGHIDCVEMLLRQMASVDGVVDEEGNPKPGNSALLLAAENEHSEVVRVLVSQGANVHLARALVVKDELGLAKPPPAAAHRSTPMTFALSSPALAEAFMEGFTNLFSQLGEVDCKNELELLAMFQKIFTTDFVARCIALKGSAATKCINMIFRRPPPSAQNTRLPVRSYMSTALRTNLRATLFRPEPGVGFGALVLDHDKSGTLKQVPIQMSCFYIPGIICNDVLHALSVTPNAEIYETVAAQAIINEVWNAIAFKMSCVTLAIECCMVFCLGISTFLVIERGEHGGFCPRPIYALAIPKLPVEDLVTHPPLQMEGELSGLWVCVCLLAAGALVDLRTKVWEASYLFHRGMAHTYLSDDGNLVVWARILCTLALLPTFMVGYSLPPLHAFVAFLRWQKLLYSLNGFMKFGPRILPIIATFRSSVSFCVVIFFYTVAFSHAGWALHVCEPVQQVYRLSLLGEYTLEHLVDSGNAVQQLWFVACIFMMPVALLNVFIGVITESYDRNQDSCHTAFLKHRAMLNVRFFMQSDFATSTKADIKAKEAIMVNARKVQKITFENSYLWVCHMMKGTQDDFSASLEGRMAMLKKHSEACCASNIREADGLTAGVRRLARDFKALSAKQVRLNERLRQALYEDAPAPPPPGEESNQRQMAAKKQESATRRLSFQDEDKEANEKTKEAKRKSRRDSQSLGAKPRQSSMSSVDANGQSASEWH